MARVTSSGVTSERAFRSMRDLVIVVYFYPRQPDEALTFVFLFLFFFGFLLEDWLLLLKMISFRQEWWNFILIINILNIYSDKHLLQALLRLIRVHLCFSIYVFFY